ncbi:hypothetical protein pipiens_011610 [Culex pipiens pipiens]|uniref:F-box domain-containing protein n=1 Tax=Culex pipiens pipiens TaxID=38569 RepID=A0ABD1D5K5_CULPP
METENQILHEASSYLPSEVWEKIFLYLPTDQLGSIRQTCHYFKNVVRHCRALRDRIHLHFPKHQVLKKGYTPHSAPPASTAFIMHTTIEDTGLWWSPMGVMITELVLVACEFPLDLLRLTPKLKTLTLRDVKLRCSGPLEVNFELRELVKLAVEVGREGDLAVLIVLEQIITGLKVLEWIGKISRSSHLHGLVKLVASAQDTLDELVFHPHSSIIVALLQLKLPKLKRITFKAEYFGQKNFLDEPEIAEFVRAHPTIEELKMDNKPACNKVLSQIGHVLPQLKRFDMQVLFANEQNAMASLTMLHLQSLNLTNLLGKWLQFDSNCVGNLPSLKELHLTGVQVQGEGLERFLHQSTNLEYLSIKQSRFERWSQLPALALHLKSLVKLELDNIVFTINDQCPLKLRMIFQGA